mmetsp:Transcript_66505/g.118263  ORF Transcript_66505/g.118263 Transcript_66505/m.118263 type:complete len:103 (-) Transcript_66505:204-512(-)
MALPLAGEPLLLSKKSPLRKGHPTQAAQEERECLQKPRPLEVKGLDVRSPAVDASMEQLRLSKCEGAQHVSPPLATLDNMPPESCKSLSPAPPHMTYTNCFR